MASDRLPFSSEIFCLTVKEVSEQSDEGRRLEVLGHHEPDPKALEICWGRTRKFVVCHWALKSSDCYFWREGTQIPPGKIVGTRVCSHVFHGS